MRIANPKLNKVPIKMYSVRFLSFARDKSPKRNTDFAANKNSISFYLTDFEKY